jgi:hypothetical protein
VRNVNSPLEKPRQLEQIQLSAQIARAHLEAAESVLQSGGSTGLALSNLIVAGLIFAACLNNLREAAQTGEALPRRPGRLLIEQQTPSKQSSQAHSYESFEIAY